MTSLDYTTISLEGETVRRAILPASSQLDLVFRQSVNPVQHVRQNRRVYSNGNRTGLPNVW